MTIFTHPDPATIPLQVRRNTPLCWGLRVSMERGLTRRGAGLGRGADTPLRTMEIGYTQMCHTSLLSTRDYGRNFKKWNVIIMTQRFIVHFPLCNKSSYYIPIQSYLQLSGWIKIVFHRYLPIRLHHEMRQPISVRIRFSSPVKQCVLKIMLTDENDR